MGALGQATNKLGELFVDIGLGGVGQAIKGLNSVSASFLLVKTAAKEAVKPFVELGKTTIANSVKFGQLNATLGISLEKAQQLTTYFEQFSIGEGAIGSLGNIMDMLNRVNMGLEGIDGKFVTAMTRIGLDWRKYRGGTFEDMLNLVTDVQQKVKDMDLGQARVYMQDIGLPIDLLYAFQRGGFDINQAFTRSEESIEQAQKFNEQLKLLQQNVGKRFQDVAGKFMGVATPALETSNVLMGPDNQARQEARNELKRRTLQVAPAIVGGPMGAARTMMDLLQNSIENTPNVPAVKENLKSSAEGVTITVMNDNKIYGQNAEEVADKIAGITKDDIIAAENNAIQLSNMAGA